MISRFPPVDAELFSSLHTPLEKHYQYITNNRLSFFGSFLFKLFTFFFIHHYAHFFYTYFCNIQYTLLVSHLFCVMVNQSLWYTMRTLISKETGKDFSHAYPIVWIPTKKSQKGLTDSKTEKKTFNFFILNTSKRSY